MASSSSSSRTDSSVTGPPPQQQSTPSFPRGAVSTVVRFASSENDDDDDSIIPRYLLIERGNPPNRGVWCVPGGKIEWGETTITAAQRELAEEVKFCDNDDDVQVAWYSGAFCTSDSIQPGNNKEESGKKNPGYHYLIAQCFAEIAVTNNKKEEGGEPPKVQPSDDAQDAKWWTLEEIRQAEAKKETVPNLVIVIERAEALYQCGMLPTRIPETHT